MSSRPAYRRPLQPAVGRYFPSRARHNRARSPCVQPQVLPWSLRQALTSGDAEMSNAQDAFDAVGIVVDWIDACKQQRLDVLLDPYDDAATIECREGGTFRGRSAMEWYWRSKLAGPAALAFEIDALCL